MEKGRDLIFVVGRTGGYFISQGEFSEKRVGLRGGIDLFFAFLAVHLQNTAGLAWRLE